jgi:hypothetical protein
MKDTKSIRLPGVIALCILAVIALYLVYGDYQRRAIREKIEQERAIERRATAEIQKLGGGVTFGSPPDLPVISVTFMFTSDGEVTDEGLPVIHDSKVTDKGLKHLKELTKLQSLYLAANKVTDEGLKHLKGLTSLETLHLSNTKVTDAGLEHLKGLSNLRSLTIRNSQVTDEGLVHLKGLTNLQSLSLTNTKVTDEGVERLQAAIPNCRITH